MEEMIDVLDEFSGKITGETITKTEAHSKGIWHGSIHLLIVSEDHKKVLLQRRCEIKKYFPNVWDVAVGGHISAGEDDITTVKRELEEELGLNPDVYDIKYLTKYKEAFVNNGIDSREFVSLFIIYSDINIDDIKLQKEEVSDIKWFSKKEFLELISSNNCIPHIQAYNALKEILTD